MQWKTVGIAIFSLILTWLPATTTQAVERGKLPIVSDLRKEAQIAEEKKIPILILFSAPGCPYCERVRDEVLIPTTYNAEYDDKVIMVEVDGSYRDMVDFDGRTLTQSEFMSKHHVGFAPTVKFFDAKGREVADPIIGLVTVDYYGGFMDQGIDQATARIRASAR